MPGAKSRSWLVRAHQAKKAGYGMLASQLRRSRSWASGWAVSPVTVAMQAAVSVARRRGLVYRVCTPRLRSHRPIRVACCRPMAVSRGSPRRALLLAVLDQVDHGHADDPARP